MPAIKIYLSCVDRLSIMRMTVLDKPSVLTRLRTRLCAPFKVLPWSRMPCRMEDPTPSSSSTFRLASCKKRSIYH